MPNLLLIYSYATPDFLPTYFIPIPYTPVTGNGKTLNFSTTIVQAFISAAVFLFFAHYFCAATTGSGVASCYTSIMRRTTILALCLALFIPIICYLFVKYASE